MPEQQRLFPKQRHVTNTYKILGLATPVVCILALTVFYAEIWEFKLSFLSGWAVIIYCVSLFGYAVMNKIAVYKGVLNGGRKKGEYQTGLIFLCFGAMEFTNLARDWFWQLEQLPFPEYFPWIVVEALVLIIASWIASVFIPDNNSDQK